MCPASLNHLLCFLKPHLQLTPASFLASVTIWWWNCQITQLSAPTHDQQHSFSGVGGVVSHSDNTQKHFSNHITGFLPTFKSWAMCGRPLALSQQNLLSALPKAISAQLALLSTLILLYNFASLTHSGIFPVTFTAVFLEQGILSNISAPP